MEHRSRKKVQCRFISPNVLAIAAVFAAALLLAGGMMMAGGRKRFLTDANAVDSAQKPLTKAEMQIRVQQAADASAFRFRINSQPTVKQTEMSGQQSVNWNLSNSIENKFNMEVVVVLEDGTEIYRSGTLTPGQQSLTGTLTQNLSPGIYQAVATAYALDKNTGETIGAVSTDLTISVES